MCYTPFLTIVEIYGKSTWRENMGLGPVRNSFSLVRIRRPELSFIICVLPFF